MNATDETLERALNTLDDPRLTNTQLTNYLHKVTDLIENHEEKIKNSGKYEVYCLFRDDLLRRLIGKYGKI